MLKKTPEWTFLQGKKIKKSDFIFDVLGDLDELNAVLGLARVFSRKESNRRFILGIQKNLIEIGGFLSGVVSQINFNQKVAIIEGQIDELKDSSFSSFLLPGQSEPGAFLNLGRVVCRRLERRAVGLEDSRLGLLIAYLNKLSLLLFWLTYFEEKGK